MIGEQLTDLKVAAERTFGYPVEVHLRVDGVVEIIQKTRD